MLGLQQTRFVELNKILGNFFFGGSVSSSVVVVVTVDDSSAVTVVVVVDSSSKVKSYDGVLIYFVLYT